MQASADGCKIWAPRGRGDATLHYNHTSSVAARLECSKRERISGLRNMRCGRVASLVSTPLHYSLGAPLARQSEDVAPTCFNGAKFTTSPDGVKFTTEITTSPVTNRPLRHWWPQQRNISGAGETLRGGKGETLTEQPLLAHALSCKDGRPAGEREGWGVGGGETRPIFLARSDTSARTRGSVRGGGGGGGGRGGGVAFSSEPAPLLQLLLSKTPGAWGASRVEGEGRGGGGGAGTSGGDDMGVTCVAGPEM
jgi:hypothetical protein